jgi:DNA-binding transcriptional LysR family regulator
MASKAAAPRPPVVQGQDPRTSVRAVASPGTAIEQTRARAAERTSELRDLDLTGEVKISATEGLGTFWIAPRIVDFHVMYPRLLVNLSCTMRPADLERLGAGVAVQLLEPADPRAEKIRLGTLHAYPFAASSYIQRFGIPRSLGEIRKHKLVLQFGDQTGTQEHYDRVLPGVPQAELVAVRTNSSIVHYWTIVNGTGIGCLPTYAMALANHVVPIDLGLHFPFPIWLIYRREAAALPRVHRTIDWLVDAFDSKRYPWFSETFIHPKELLEHYHGPPLVNPFECFAIPTHDPTSIH